MKYKAILSPTPTRANQFERLAATSCWNGSILCPSGGAMQIAPGVYSMGNWKGGKVRAFLLDDGHELTLVDTLFETDARLILEELRSTGHTPADIKRIVLSHAHRSHLGGLAALKRLSGA